MNIVLSGASKGIGRAIAFFLVDKGHNLSICARNFKDLSNLRTELLQKNSNLKIHIAQVDVSIKEQVIQYGKDALEFFGNIDILINNAGSYEGGELLLERDGLLESMINVNLMSAYHLTRAIAPNMVDSKKGMIVNMCSIASVNAYPNGGAYSISKFALLGFSKNLREELKNKGVKVMSILPGATWSDSWKGVDLPYARLMEADDIAKIILASFDLSDSAVIEEIILRPQLGDL
jgi:short-subunit dehydrogenase